MVSILDSFPHRCRIDRRTRTKGTLGGSRDATVTEQTNVECWEQHATSSEILDYEKRGMVIDRKIYFLSERKTLNGHQKGLPSS